MNGAEVNRIVSLTDDEAARERRRLTAAEARAYERYCSGVTVPRAEPGSPQAAGHGSRVCDLNAGGVQDAWLAARDTREAFDRVRSGPWRSRATGEVEPGVVAYEVVVDFVRHAIEVVTHGVDVSSARTPAEAVRLVRLHAAARRLGIDPHELDDRLAPHPGPRGRPTP